MNQNGQNESPSTSSDYPLGLYAEVFVEILIMYAKGGQYMFNRYSLYMRELPEIRPDWSPLEVRFTNAILNLCNLVTQTFYSQEIAIAFMEPLSSQP